MFMEDSASMSETYVRPSPAGQAKAVRPSVSMIDIGECYFSGLERYFVRDTVFSEHSDKRARWQVSDDSGRGFVEMFHLHSGLSVGICDYSLNRSFCKETVHGVEDYLRFNLLISGAFEAQLPQGKRSWRILPGDLWLSAGRKSLLYHHPAVSDMKGISIEIPWAMMEGWLDQYADGSLSRRMKRLAGACANDISGLCPIAKSITMSHPALRMANHLCGLRCRTIYDQLHFESLSIDILAEFLNMDAPLSTLGAKAGDEQSRRHRAVCDALDILQEEWATPPTIIELARRVGVNECYLKTDFREKTGNSIGAYVRKLRMEKARALIESGEHTILQVALFVGYSNPSHFSKAFKRQYGRLPSFYASKSRSFNICKTQDGLEMNSHLCDISQL